MIVFSRPPGRRRRAVDVSTSSSGARPAGGREKRPSGRPCRLLRSRRAVLVMDRITAGHAPNRRTRKADRCVTLL